jgi:DNA-binding transcriptional regulator YdaS (Cro superfamily)
MHVLTSYRKTNKVSLEKLGESLGVTKAAVRYWERKGVPPERLVEIEKATGIPRAKLRPDLFGEA